MGRGGVVNRSRTKHLRLPQNEHEIQSQNVVYVRGIISLAAFSRTITPRLSFE
jgi:hypothetical protein